jgi:hypothetical protein
MLNAVRYTMHPYRNQIMSYKRRIEIKFRASASWL